jgi:monovalent cation:H+ antiporter-2, CPA2 family
MGLAGDLCLIVIAAWFAGLSCHLLRLPLVLGYIAAGVALSPYTWGPTVHGAHEVEMLADVGVALLLFTVGLEFPLPRLSQVGKVALIGTPIQVALTIGWGAVLGHFCGWTGLQGVWLGALLSLSSTTVVLRCLSQNGVLSTLSSQVMIGILVVQDLCSVPLLLVMPRLGQGEGSYATIGRTVLVGVVFVTFWLWLAKSWLPRAMARLVALNSRELFSLTVLAFGLGIGYTAYLLGLSLAFGAFLAGLVLAESEYAHQALSDVSPLRDLFTLIFFASVGMLVDPHWVWSNIGLLLPLIIGSWAGKGLILALIVRSFGYSNVVPWASALYLGQMGELAFVIARLGTQSGSLSNETYKVLITIAAVSMALTPLLAPWTQPVYGLWRRLRPKTITAPQSSDCSGLVEHTIIAGFGRVGRVVAATLQTLELPFVVVERDEHALGQAKAAGFSVIYGEASAPPVLEAAGLSHARNIILTFAIPLDVELTVRAIHSLTPKIPVIARGSNQEHIEHLSSLGVGCIVVAEMEGALEMVHQCLDQLGLSAPDTQTLVEEIRMQHYKALIPESALLPSMLRRILRQEQNELVELIPGWVGQPLRSVIQPGWTVLAVVRSAGSILRPESAMVLLEGDQLLVQFSQSDATRPDT